MPANDGLAVLGPTSKYRIEILYRKSARSGLGTVAAATLCFEQWQNVCRTR